MDKFFPKHIFLDFFQSLYLSAAFGFVSLVPGLQGWFIENEMYVQFALGFIIADHLLGTFVHSPIHKNDFDFIKNITGFCIKLSLVIIMGYIIEGLAHVAAEEDALYIYIRMSGRFLVLLYPALSAMRNMNYITKGRFPGDLVVGKWERVKDNGVDELKK